MPFSNFFDERLNTRIHIIQITLTVLVIAFAIGRMTIMSPPPTRANAIGITMGIKSLVVVGYQLLTAHNRSFYRWASLKANAVLNCLEVVFWFMVVLLSGMALSSDHGVAAGLSAVAMLLAIVLDFLAMWTAVVSVRQHRAHKHGANAQKSVQDMTTV